MVASQSVSGGASNLRRLSSCLRHFSNSPVSVSTTTHGSATSAMSSHLSDESNNTSENNSIPSRTTTTTSPSFLSSQLISSSSSQTAHELCSPPTPASTQHTSDIHGHSRNLNSILPERPEIVSSVCSALRTSFPSSVAGGHARILWWTMLLLVLASLHAPASARIRSRGVRICRGIPCANGGTLRVSNSIWGDCRCQCPASYVGPYCQHHIGRKRSLESSSPSGPRRRLSRSELLNGIRSRLIALDSLYNGASTTESHRTRMSQRPDVNVNSLDVQPATIETLWAGSRPRRRRSWPLFNFAARR